jgi:hypothetical protein
MEADNSIDVIENEYYWVRVHKEICRMVDSCTIWKERKLVSFICTPQEIDIHIYPMVNVNRNVSGA